MFPPNFRDMLCAFSAEGVEFLLVGGYAIGLHGFSRQTGDIDFWVRRTPENAARVIRALAAFGAPLMGLTATEDATLVPALFARWPGTQIVTVMAAGTDAVVYELKPQQRPLGQMSPTEIVDAVRVAVHRSRELAQNGT